MNQGMPSPQDFAQGRVTNPAQSEVIRQRLYDWNLYPTAGQAQLSFFQTQIGAGVTSAIGAVAGTTKSKSDTNMTLAGQLPSGIQYLVESIEVVFVPGSVSTANTFTIRGVTIFAAANATTVSDALNDVNTFYNAGLLSFDILQKNYLTETPLMSFPPKAYLEGSLALASTSATAGEVTAITLHAAGRPYYVEPRIQLQPAMNWGITLIWPAAVVTPSGFNARVGVFLDGYMMRSSQ